MVLRQVSEEIETALMGSKKSVNVQEQKKSLMVWIKSRKAVNVR